MTLQYAPQLVAVGTAYPSSHVIEKVVGDPFTLRWGAWNNAPAGAMSGWVRLRVFESDPVRGPIVIGGIDWVELVPGQSLLSGLRQALPRRQLRPQRPLLPHRSPTRFG